MQLPSASSNASASLGEQQTLSACQLHLQQRAHALLAVCPGLPGFCPRSGAPDAPSTQQAPYLKPGGPGDAQMAQQNAAVATFIAGPGFQERLSQLQQLPDKQGILIAAGKPHHVGNAAIMLHVSCHNQAAVGCRAGRLPCALNPTPSTLPCGGRVAWHSSLCRPQRLTCLWHSFTCGTCTASCAALRSTSCSAHTSSLTHVHLSLAAHPSAP